MRRGEHLRAQPPKKHVQAMRRGEHLRVQPPRILQALQRARHPRAQPHKEELQGLPAEGGLVLSSRRERLFFCHCSCSSRLGFVRGFLSVFLDIRTLASASKLHVTQPSASTTAKEAGASNASVRAQPHQKRVKAMRRLEHLRAQPPKIALQAMRRGGASATSSTAAQGGVARIAGRRRTL
jgi:hypothetical protein